MDISQLYQNLAYVFWAFGGVCFLLTIFLSFRFHIIKVIKGLSKNDNVISVPQRRAEYNRKVSAPTNPLPVTEGTKALIQETKPLMQETKVLVNDYEFYIIFDVVEIHTDEIID